MYKRQNLGGGGTPGYRGSGGRAGNLGGSNMAGNQGYGTARISGGGGMVGSSGGVEGANDIEGDHANLLEATHAPGKMLLGSLVRSNSVCLSAN